MSSSWTFIVFDNPLLASSLVPRKKAGSAGGLGVHGPKAPEGTRYLGFYTAESSKKNIAGRI